MIVEPRVESRRIKVKFTFAGLHAWPAAPDSVGFLRKPHRHIFGVTLVVPVKHDDRDLEFILVEREVLNSLDLFWNRIDDTREFDLGSDSCEMAAERIGAAFLRRHPSVRWCEVEVDEDGGSSGTVLLGSSPR